MLRNDRDALVKKFKAIIDDPSVDIYTMRSILLVIPGCSGRKGGLGIDTTKLFKQSDSVVQYHHGVRVNPTKTVQNWWDKSSAKTGRAQRDIVHASVKHFTKDRWRLLPGDGKISSLFPGIKQEPNTVMLFLTPVPSVNIYRKLRNELLSDFKAIIEVVKESAELLSSYDEHIFHYLQKRQLAFMMAWHPRLGEQSLISKYVAKDVGKMIARYIE